MIEMARSRRQWLLAGQALLRRGGVGAVKLQALTEEIGLTTGSFYHHFAGMGEYLDELAGYYGADELARVLESLSPLPPRTRLHRLLAITTDEQMFPVDAAMRDWAGSNPIAAASVRATDAAVLRFMEQAFTDLGHPPPEARTRALLLISAGVARIQRPWPPEEALERVLDVLAPT